MKINLNGEALYLADGSSLANLMGVLAIGRQAIAVAVNRQVISRSQWQQHVLQKGDQVDVVRAIGGG